MNELQLAAFQTAAIDRAYRQLRSPNGSRRFLLADEVGLGKTIVAKGVIDRLLKDKGSLDVVYLCSNAEIGDQNRDKLDPRDDDEGSALKGGAKVRRIMQLATRDSRLTRPLRLYAFTPGTSLGGGTGLAYERRLVMYLLHRVARKPVAKQRWRRYFQCTAGESWMEQTKLRELRSEFLRRVPKGVQQQVLAAWRAPSLRLGKRSPLEMIDEAVASFDLNDASSTRYRAGLIAVLREGVQRAILRDLQPDLIILDEVQRFADVLRRADDPATVEGQLFARRSPVLVLSATPYRMLSLDHEGDAHYSEFFETLRFLFGSSARGAGQVETVRADLDAFGKQLDSGAFLNGEDLQLRSLRERLETSLSAVMSRTERTWYVDDRKKGVQDEWPGLRAVSRDELSDYLRLRRFLLDRVKTSHHVTQYWKSCPAPLSFMDSSYALMRDVRLKPKLLLPKGVVTRVQDLQRLDERSVRLRELRRIVLGDKERRSPWRYLWTKPAYVYYRDGFFGKDGAEGLPRKALVFSGWRFVPKAISLLLSRAAEGQIGRDVLRRTEKKQQPLRFTEGLAFHPFDVCYPSVALARAVSPALFMQECGRLPRARDLQRLAERNLRERLRKVGVDVGATKDTPLWRAVARLEAGDEGIIDALMESGVCREVEVFSRYVEQLRRWREEPVTPLRISEEQLRHLARIAVFSPAVSILRGLWAVYPEQKARLPEGSIDLCLGALRSYFNKPYVRAVVATSDPSKGYARRVLSYCEVAHFQAMIDEHLFLVRDVMQVRNPADAANHLGRILSLGVGQPQINVSESTAGGEERLRAQTLSLHSHFAMSFGDDVHGVSGEREVASSESRRTAVREAFNSPFWPFVLATTSVGQEGLDFHLYCRDIVHWNLPSNPVDLEQREGRINRRDCLALRSSIRRDWNVERVFAMASTAQACWWRRVFEAIKNERGGQSHKHDLYPHWVYDCRDGENVRIRRHLLFHEASDDTRAYESLIDRLALYRLVFGQPRQQDLLERLERRVKGFSGRREDIEAQLMRYMINLSPLRDEPESQGAIEEANETVLSREALRRLMADIVRVRAVRAGDFVEVVPALDSLCRVIERHIAREPVAEGQVREAISALRLLQDPGDESVDRAESLGRIAGRLMEAARRLQA